jgi:hypothetical protein
VAPISRRSQILAARGNPSLPREFLGQAPANRLPALLAGVNAPGLIPWGIDPRVASYGTAVGGPVIYGGAPIHWTDSKMVYRGLMREALRADILAFLKSKM